MKRSSNNHGNVCACTSKDWLGRSGTCKSDGNQPLYMELYPALWLYDNLEACCERYFGGFGKSRCMNEVGSGLWLVDHAEEKCVLDCEEGSGVMCGGLATAASDQLFTSPWSCCQEKLSWVLTEFCEVSECIRIHHFVIIIFALGRVHILTL